MKVEAETWAVLKLAHIIANLSVITARAYDEGVIFETPDVYLGLPRRDVLKYMYVRRYIFMLWLSHRAVLYDAVGSPNQI
jgi:hypothetical protein